MMISSYSSMVCRLWQSVCLIFVGVLAQHGHRLMAETDVPTLVPDVTSFSDYSFPNGLNYYRYLRLESVQNILYVGARKYVYRLNADQIDDLGRNYKRSSELPANHLDVSSCQLKQNDEQWQYVNCENHIRTIIEEGGDLVVCGTGAYSPIEATLRKSDLVLLEMGGRDSGESKCPFSPDETYACVHVVNKNPSSIPTVYSGTVMQPSSGKIPKIYRPELLDNLGNTVYTELNTKDSETWLKDVTFVAAFDMDDYVYFFFHEDAVEYSCVDMRVSRVARVCKSDIGGNISVLKKKWTTYLKARLSCHISDDDADSPTTSYFNVLKDVQKDGDTFYGIFTASDYLNDGKSSAICAFNKDDIHSIFETGSFMEQDEITNEWSVVPDNEVPSPRPGKCSNDSQNLPGTILGFMEKHPLMNNQVEPITEEPLYIQTGVEFQKLGITRIYTAQDVVVLFVTSSEGHIYKLVHVPTSEEIQLVNVMKPFGDSDRKVWSLKYGNGFVYLGTDTQVMSVDVDQCSKYTYCTDCVRDPHCGWLQGLGCSTYTSGSWQAVTGSALQTCTAASSCKTESSVFVRVPGDPIYLKCESKCKPEDPVTWEFDQRQIHIDDTKYIQTTNNGLVVLNITNQDVGDYVCKSGYHQLRVYNVALEDCADDPECVWKKEFRNWCQEFDRYKKEFDDWQCRKDDCYSSCPNLPSSGQCP